jgi:AP-4 complex subunit epsilon-1
MAKRIGYLVSSIFLNPMNELMILLINTIQKDLKSTNLLEVSFALIVVSKLVSPEMVPAVSSLVVPLLMHQSEMIRRRALIAYHRFIQLMGEDLDGLVVQQILRRALTDPDPGVMAVALNPICELAKDMPESFVDILPSLVGIFRQILEYKLPKDYEYHRLPAPWLQIKLIQIFGLLAPTISGGILDSIYETLTECMRRADVMSNAGAAIVYEVIKTAVKLSPNHSLLEHCSLMVAKFMKSDNHNYKYIGVTSLSLLASINPIYANEHQMTVVECLEDVDETLKRKTIDLLYQMTHPGNVEIVVERMLVHLSAAGNCDHKKDLVKKITSLSEQFAPSPVWYLETINLVFLECDFIDPQVAYNLIRLVAETDLVEDGEEDLRLVAGNEYVKFLEKFVANEATTISTQFLRLIVWMVGEFGTMSSLEGYTVDDIVDLLIDGLSRCRDDISRGYFVTALAKIGVHASPVARDQIFKIFGSSWESHDIQRRCREYLFVYSLAIVCDQSCHLTLSVKIFKST